MSPLDSRHSVDAAGAFHDWSAPGVHDCLGALAGVQVGSGPGVAPFFVPEPGPDRTVNSKRLLLLALPLAALFFAAGRASVTLTSQVGRPAPAAPAPWSAQLVRVLDGDTLRLRLRPPGPVEEPVRLLEIDTPERGHPGHREAAAALRALLAGAPLRLEFEPPGAPRRDRYGRLLAYLFAGETNVNVVMVRLGRARWTTRYGKGRHARAFRAAQESAKKARRGLWGS